MEYKQIKVKDVKKADYNPRIISPEELEKLKRSLKEFGCVRPLVINMITGNLVSGHQMLEAAKELNMEYLPYIEVELSEDKEKSLNLVMNKVQGDWDYDMLKVILEELDEKNLIDTSGFTKLDLEIIKDIEKDEEKLLMPMDTKQEFKLTFTFDNELLFEEANAYFSNRKVNWNSKEPNTNLLMKVIKKVK